MIEINTPKSVGGFIFTIKSIEKVTIICPKSCSYIRDKDYDCWYVSSLRRLGITFNKGKIDCIKAVMNVKNVGDSDWVVEAEDAVLVDQEGFSYKGIILCEDCLPPRTVESKTHIPPQTQADYIQLFPILESNCEIAKIKVNFGVGNKWMDYEMSDNVNDPFEGLETSSPATSHPVPMSNITCISHEESMQRWQIRNCTDKINKLKTNIYSRLNNILTESEKTKLENKIANDLYNIKIELESKTESAFDEIRDLIQEVEFEYAEAIQSQNEKEKNRKTLSQKVEELLELSPREFEQYIGELFTHLGYTVEVTQFSNDKGIDIIMTKDDVKYGVQCKRYKGTVGSPEIQTFIGALNHLQADKGYFVTTGMFSFEAEKMAAQHPIQLINRVDLAKLIIEALDN